MNFIDRLRHALGFDHSSSDLEDADTLLANEEIVSPVSNVRSQRPTAPHFENATRQNRQPGTPQPRSHAPQPDSTISSDLARARDELRIAQEHLEDEQQLRRSLERQKSALTERLYELDRQLLETREKTDALTAENTRISEELRHIKARVSPDGPTALEKEISRLKADNQALMIKNTMADSLIKELTTKAATANRQLKEANAELSDAEAVLEQVKRFDEHKQKMDMRAAELQRTISLRDKEIRSLNTTIEHNLVRHAEAVHLLEKEIERLRSALPADSDTEPQTRRKPERRSSRPDKAKSETRQPEAPDPQMSLF